MWIDLEFGGVTSLLEISGVQTNASYDFGFYATAPTIANMRFKVGALATDIVAAEYDNDDDYHFKELTSLTFDTTEAVIAIEQTDRKSVV